MPSSFVEYGIKSDGSLIMLSHTEQPVVGTGWDKPQRVFSTTIARAADLADVRLYAIQPDGTLQWFNHNGALRGKGILDGPGYWEGPRKVGQGWQDLQHVFAVGSVIYAIQSDGTLLWFNHKGALSGQGISDGSGYWEGPRKVGQGWQDLQHVFATGSPFDLRSSRIYAIKNDGSLLWFNHGGISDGKGILDGPGYWAGPQQVGTGWQDLAAVYSVGRYIYAIKKDGTRLQFEHTGYEKGIFLWDGPTEVSPKVPNLRAAFGGFIVYIS